MTEAKKKTIKKTKTTQSKTCGGKKEQRGGSVVSDMTKLAVPFGLIAAKNTLERFIKNREKELKKIRSKK
tara:strand:+ start:548 stop:757 length:210 start_codon:yes stop_codon:yes gene_type:complete